ncbi:hypothetical protein D7X55_20500 [Corallococcus sp. AB049A]|uniref:Uncharacterized protein n=1 Tax=Corallococcus interemptor TaxID=2316720 RepID=A0A3A8R6E1_9BACT|nr:MULTISPECIES: hypothetical protein [Corallococcus]RKH72802.1 hypothetical protein D7X96_03810 [Corallococcus interemptor]RKI63289.1 hypothetical protein D7X55_20500 [Corallococcus sp. AB049A]
MLPRGYRYLLSLGLLLTGVACRSPEALRKRADAQVEQAATHAWAGELARARKELAEVLKDSPQHPGALKVQTCVLLELGALDEADQAVSLLQATRPDAPEIAVLAALVEARRQTPVPGWREALIQAWNRAGRPDLKESASFPAPRSEETSFVGAVWERTQSPEIRFTAMLADTASDAQRQWLAAHVSELKDPNLLLAAYEYFQARSGEDALADVRRQARETLRRKLEPIAAGASESEGPLLLLLGESAKDAPLTSADLQALERIAALPRYRSLTLGQAGDAAKQRLESTGITPPAIRLFQAATASQVLDVTLILKKRVEATRERLSHEERIRLGQAVYTLGERIAAGPALIDRLVGLSQMRQGAELMEDAAKLAQATRDLEHVRAVHQATTSLQVDTWPLPSLHRDWVQAALDDEWKSLSALVTP